MSTLKIVLLAFGAVALMTAAIIGYIYWDARTNYMPVQARVTAIDEDVCVLHRSSSGKRSSRTTDPMPCGEARRLERTREYRRYDVQERKTIAYRYTSPVDNRSHAGAITVERGDYPNVREGGEIGIFAHATRPEVSRRPI